MSYLWSCVEQAEKDNVNDSNDYSYRLVNITGSLGLKDVNNKFRDEVVGPLTQQLLDDDPKHYFPPIDLDPRLDLKYKPEFEATIGGSTINMQLSSIQNTDIQASHHL